MAVKGLMNCLQYKEMYVIRSISCSAVTLRLLTLVPRETSLLKLKTHGW